MNQNLKNRIVTSLILIFITILMFFSNEILAFILLIGSVLSFIEFSKMIKIIKKNKNLIQFIYNLTFLIYIFLFSTFFIITSFHLNLKIVIFTILFICISSDIGGIIFGKIFKGPKLIKISPNKTISGSIGSFLFSIVFSIILFNFLTNEVESSFILIGIGISFSVQIGDLFFSYLKRKSKLKDTGNILPGHGGLLDRIDGILLGLPAGFILIVFLL